jgi:type VI secretion system FHA domain protein
MILGLAVVRHGDEQLVNPVKAGLGARCAIGRGRECDVVLEDPTRHVSRLHAVITRQGDGYFLSVESRLNPVMVNGRPVTAGQQAQLGPGDVLVIGEYELNVIPEERDSITTLLGGPVAGAAPPSGGSGLEDIFGSLPEHRAPSGPSPGSARIDELLAPPPSSRPASEDPLAALLGNTGSPRSRATDPAEDPLLSLLGDSGSRSEAPITPSSDLGREFGATEGVSSIDDLLGGAASIRSDPLGLGLLGSDRQAQSGYVGSGGRGAGAGLDHVSDVNLPVSLPTARGAAPTPAAPRAAAPGRAEADLDPLAALLGSSAPAQPSPAGADPLDSLFGDAAPPPPRPAAPPPAASVPDIPPRAATPPPVSAATALPEEEDPLAALLGRAMVPGAPGDPSLLFGAAPEPLPSPPEAPPAAPAAPQQFVETTVFSVDTPVPTGRSPYASPNELRAADAAPATDHASRRNAVETFLAGAGMQGVNIPDDQVDAFLQECGATVRAAVEGIMGMLLARAKVREELRASDRTMVASRENNALKLIDSVDEALKYVFDPATRADDAFLPPPKAVADACNDLQAHEIALVAGMRAALMGSIKKFEPAVVEKKLEKEGGKSLLANKKAQLWDRFVAYHDEISKDAEDNFDRVFGADFLRTYTEQVKRLRR